MSKRRGDESVARLQRKLQKLQRRLKNSDEDDFASSPGTDAAPSELPVLLDAEDDPAIIDHEETVEGVSNENGENIPPNSQNAPTEGAKDSDFCESDSSSADSSEGDLDEATRRILGVIPSTKKQAQINKSVKRRWDHWIVNGLTAEERAELTAKYVRKGECWLEAPQLNPEVETVLPASDKTRDRIWASTQNTVGSALSAVGQLMTSLIEANGEVDGMEMLQLLSDSGKLLTDAHFQLSKSRRATVLPKLTEKRSKEVLENV